MSVGGHWNALSSQAFSTKSHVMPCVFLMIKVTWLCFNKVTVLSETAEIFNRTLTGKEESRNDDKEERLWCFLSMQVTQKQNVHLHKKDMVNTAHMHRHMTASSVSFYQVKSQNLCPLWL